MLCRDNAPQLPSGHSVTIVPFRPKRLSNDAACPPEGCAGRGGARFRRIPRRVAE